MTAIKGLLCPKITIMKAENQTEKKPQSQGFNNPHIFKNDNEAKSKSNLLETPSISLPKGGGAIHNIDEKFQVNTANGTIAFSLPFPAAPARGGMTPPLALSYNSGAGNSLFGIGWQMSLPMIARKTDKKLPQYQDVFSNNSHKEGSDIFTFSGAEDLVPLLKKDQNGIWQAQISINNGIKTTQFRPRIEGSFAKIQFFQLPDSTSYWQVTSKENSVSIFGKSENARIAHPTDKTKIFSWLLETSYDDKGNIVQYAYKKENTEQVAPNIWEKKRQFSNRHIKRIRYGNVTPFDPSVPDQMPNDFTFDIVFDYGEHDIVKPSTLEKQAWTARQDAFSDHRAGFDIRTYRLCRRVLMFHQFPTELGFADYLVRSWDFNYDEKPHLTYLENLKQVNFIWHTEGGLRERHEAAPLIFHYQKPEFDRTVRELPQESTANLPIGLDGTAYQFTDLYAEGISGILTEQAEGWFFKENYGNGHFNTAQLVSPKPAVSGAAWQIQDLAANGKKYLVSMGNSAAQSPNILTGYFELSPIGEEWQPFKTFSDFPNINLQDPNLKMLDLDGDGLADILITDEAAFRWHPSRGTAGYDAERLVFNDFNEEPTVIFSNADEKLLIAVADMSGDGLADIVRVTNNEVSYFPNLGYGRFGKKITLGNTLAFAENKDSFNPKFIQFGDIDGSGTTDILYIGQQKIQVYFNQSGNQLSAPVAFFNPFPRLDNATKISVVDLLGNGTACLVWSSPLPQHAATPLRYVDFMNSKKPHLLIGYDNNLGKTNRFEFKPSTFYYLEDKKAGKKWATKLPFPVHCVSKVIVEDAVSQTRFTSEYRYRHGYYDGQEREFRGFAYVEQRDTEGYETYKKNAADGQTSRADLFQPAVITKNWFHTGAYRGAGFGLKIKKQGAFHPLSNEYFDTKPLLPEANFPQNLTTIEIEEAFRSLKGLPLRQEIYSDEGTPEEQALPYSIVQFNYDIQHLQPILTQRHAVFFPFEKEKLTFHLERKPNDPRIAHSINLEIDPFGNIKKQASIVYARRLADANLPTQADRDKQTTQYFSITENDFTNTIDDATGYRLPLPCESKTWELVLPSFDTNVQIAQNATILNAFNAAQIVDYQQNSGVGQKRKIEHSRTYFRRNDLTGLLPLGKLESLALSGESFALALTTGLATHLFGNRVDANLLLNEGKYKNREGVATEFWISSGQSLPYPNLCNQPTPPQILPPTPADRVFAQANFYQPSVFIDAFGTITKLCYDARKIFIETLTDAVGNETAVEKFNYRSLSPAVLRDMNGNRSGIRLDAAGRVTAVFSFGKQGENIGDFMANTVESDISDKPSAIFEYFDKNFLSQQKPNYVHSIAFETHHFDNIEPRKMQETYVYSGGSGHEILKKIQAESGDAPVRNPDGTLQIDPLSKKPVFQNQLKRWVGNGCVILNNKGKTVKQYEPFFDSTFEYNTEKELVEIGVTDTFYYDALGRLIKTVHPNGTFSKTEFDSWETGNF